MSTKLFCLTADNASNNDSACDSIEQVFYQQQIYLFNSTFHCLPCLAHVLNLAIMDVMSANTQIANMEMTTAIWEFDPSLPSSHTLGDSLDVVAAIQTIAIKIQCSGQHIEYFHTLQNNCVHWGTAAGMLGHAYHLHQPINLFISSADELFGPITTICCNGQVAKRIPWSMFTFKVSNWEHLNDVHSIIADANNLQQSFSSETCAMLWHAIPALKELQMAWKAKKNME
ncbi:hypothetical protein SCLCIDRAFT_34272 [Scleroderma citrinum Foug A]|uniref:DUF659 domain-containing protein n=1 Tax=Scleroderma citrinum Foug A TaxID=1036808 RepID=A0A0C3CPB7_9AGAM|nr:hypothetical protein SCLCIDRAFT_34272 [Scleroderma citrinum Foug A]